MENQDQIMKMFKVEELEQRLEMKGWEAGAEASTDNGGSGKVYIKKTF